MDNNIISKKLREEIKKSPYKTAYFLERLKISNSRFSSSVVGRRNWTASEVLRLCKILNLEVNDFIKN